MLFRDIRELGRDQAYTAYGALVKVPNTPGCVDILVAGTSCVDYSNLNNTKVRVQEMYTNEECFFFGCVAFGGCGMDALFACFDTYVRTRFLTHHHYYHHRLGRRIFVLQKKMEEEGESGSTFFGVGP